MSDATTEPAVLAALLFSVCTAGVALFQWAVAAGAPWAHLTMGGHYASTSNRLPIGVRIACVLQSALLIAMAAGLYRYAIGTLPESWPNSLVWGVVAFSALSVLANAATPSAPERKLWLPVTIVMLASSLTVALLTP